MIDQKQVVIADLLHADLPAQEWGNKAARLSPSQLSSGDHSFYLHGVTGPIGVFAINNEPNPQLYAGNLANLHGMLLAFGDFHSTIEAAQPSLF